ncbi:MAG: isopentenyl phosphate kinase [Candidatus Helarchaeota archaeon]
MNKKIKILKLGGSLLTDKNKPFSLRKDVINNVIEQIIKSKEKLILIHGGGSFGHPLAKQYNIIEGPNSEIKDQILGLVKTHNAMVEFNNYIIKQFIDRNIPVISLQPSSLFFKIGNEIIFNSINLLETILNLNIMPILYGDIIFSSKKSFSIISGDEIIVELCKHIKNYRITKVIFAIETDGIYIQNDKGIKSLLKNINFTDLNNIKLANLDKKIDVTGGIKFKLNKIRQIVSLKIPVQIINGLKPEYVYNALKDKEITSTYIY